MSISHVRMSRSGILAAALVLAGAIALVAVVPAATLLSAAAPARAGEAATGTAPKAQTVTTLRLNLSDGSLIIGQPETEQVVVKTDHGDLKMKWDQIRTVAWKAADAPAEVTLTNGDTLTGRLGVDKLTLKTLLGDLSVPVAETRRLTVTTAAKGKGSGGQFSLKFDGKQNYVEVPAHASLDPMQAMTLECWYKTTAPQTQDMLGKRRWRPGGFDQGYEFNVNEGRLEGYWAGGGMLLSNPGANDGRWHHAAMTWNGNTQRLFNDGRVASQTNPAPWTPAQTTFRIGGVDGNANGISCFEGIICQVRLSKIDRYGDKNFTPPLRFEVDKDTIALWDFSEGSGDVVHDASGNGHNGKFVGTPAPEWVADVPAEAPQPPNPIPEPRPNPPPHGGSVVTAAR
jgi:hypothetical protein